MKKRIELFREGQPTEDGRLIRSGVISFPEDKPVPLMTMREGEGYARICGMVDNFERVDGRVYGDVSTDEYDDIEAVTVDISGVQWDYGVTLTILLGRLAAVHVASLENYPWKDD